MLLLIKSRCWWWHRWKAVAILTLPYLAVAILTLPYLSYLTPPHLTLFDFIFHYLAVAIPTLPDLALPYLGLPYLTLPNLTLPYRTLPCLAVACLVLLLSKSRCLVSMRGNKLT